MDKLSVDKVLFYFGLTEACPMVSMTATTAETINKENCLGWPLYYLDCKIVDVNGIEVKTGEVGELTVRGPNVFKGYYKMPEETKKALRDGWLYTGDLCRVDEDGCIFFVDRLKDMIKSGGENVYAIEVEMAIMKANPEILEVAVIGVPDDRWGEAVRAVVVLRKDAKKVSEEEIMKRTREYIAGFKIPKSIVFADEFPRSTSGKIQKIQLRKMYS
jgi:acyl-CoA synthetase (AMP-forming)/AMP-acid ligase II